MNKEDFQRDVLPMSKRIYPLVFRMMGNRADAEDAVQDIMIKLWDRRSKMRAHPNLVGFVFLTARNHCLDILKKKGLRVEELVIDLPSDQEMSGQDALEWKELQQFIYGVLQEIPRQQRDVLVLRDIDGYEYSEIAALLTLNVEHVRVLVSRARKYVGHELRKLQFHEKH